MQGARQTSLLCPATTPRTWREFGALERRQCQHIREVTDRRAHVVEEWIRRSQMAPVDPRHVFIMLRSATRFYADFGMPAAKVLNRRRLTRYDFDAAAETMSQSILDGRSRPPGSFQ